MMTNKRNALSLALLLVAVFAMPPVQAGTADIEYTGITGATSCPTVPVYESGVGVVSATLDLTLDPHGQVEVLYHLDDLNGLEHYVTRACAYTLASGGTSDYVLTDWDYDDQPIVSDSTNYIWLVEYYVSAANGATTGDMSVSWQ